MRFDHRVAEPLPVGESRGLLDRVERKLTSLRVSSALVQPISGSRERLVTGSNSSTHLRVPRRPDCIAVLVGR